MPAGKVTVVRNRSLNRYPQREVQQSSPRTSATAVFCGAVQPDAAPPAAPGFAACAAQPAVHITSSKFRQQFSSLPQLTAAPASLSAATTQQQLVAAGSAGGQLSGSALILSSITIQSMCLSTLIACCRGQSNNRMATRNPSLNIVPSLKRGQSDFERAAADAELVGPRGEWWWTGMHPTACPGFDTEAGVLRYVVCAEVRGSEKMAGAAQHRDSSCAARCAAWDCIAWCGLQLRPADASTQVSCTARQQLSRKAHIAYV